MVQDKVIEYEELLKKNKIKFEPYSDDKIREEMKKVSEEHKKYKSDH